MSTTLKAAAILALSFAACAPAHAEDNPALRIANSAGKAIAAQGNVALLEIRREVKEKLLAKLKPLLPQTAAPAAPVLAQR